MELHYKRTGEGHPLLILHGLFGMGDNWASLSRSYAAEGFSVIVPDLRNHGRSPHSDLITYELMADDLEELINRLNLDRVSIIGHSMGGKVAMFYAARYSQRIEKLIVVDLAPKYYAPHHHGILAAIHAVEPDTITERKEAERILRDSLREESKIQFLLKNLYWKEDGKLGWRFNVSSLEKNMEEIGKALPDNVRIEVPTLFISGERSGYIQEGDKELIRKHFSEVSFTKIPDAGHWVHAENPNEFFRQTLLFLK